tara:strand:- start:259 stop:1584 length:1326 start_codon:yes stop_codon:yes gene_type:complete
MPWYDAVNKFIRKDYPGSYKQSAAGPLKSDRILGSMAKAPRGPRGKKTIRKPSYAKRQPVIRRSTKKRKRSNALGGKSFKKATRPKKLDLKFTRRHYDDYGTLNRNHSLYMGFEGHGSKNRMWDILGEAMAKTILAKLKVYPRSYAEAIGMTQYNTMRFSWKRVAVPGGQDDVLLAPDYAFAPSDTLSHIGQTIALDMQYWADITPDPTSTARYLDQVELFNANEPTVNRIYIKDVGESMVNYQVTQHIKLQNLTKNNAGGDERDVTGTNPVHGMKYEFKNHRAKLISSIQALDPNYDNLTTMNPEQGFLQGFSSSGLNDKLNQPPKARELFTNCAASTPISMGAGAFKSERTSFSMKHKLSTFVERIYYSGFDKGNWGAVTWFAFERVHRQVATAAHAQEDTIKIGFNRELEMGASITIKTQKSFLKHYENVPLGALGIP